MDFFNTRTDSTITPASLRFFTIYDPSLSRGEDSDNTEQILLYLPRNDESTSLNDRMRQISVIQGINDFSASFNEDKQGLNYIELDNTQIIFSTFENRFNFILAINLTKVEEDDGQTITYDQNLPLSYLAGLLSEGYDQFRLHNGTITSLLESMENDQLKSFLERWWIIWYQNFQFDLKENGFLKEYTDYYKKSTAKADSDLKDTVQSLHNGTNFKEFIIWNVKNDSGNGLLYEHFRSLEAKSKKRLLNWINVTNYYGLSPESLLSQNIIKISNNQYDEEEGVQENATVSEFTYDPFKLMYHTITDVSKMTGFTTGVNYGVNTVTSGLNTVTSGITSFGRYFPWASHSTDQEPQSATPKSTATVDFSRPRFLIGKVNDSSISYKQFYLQFGEEEEKLHRIVVFQNGDNLIIIIYEFTANELNEPYFYENLLVKLSDLDKFQITVTENKQHFYFVGIDHNKKAITSNLPEVPKREVDDEQDKYFLDLSKSRHQSEIIHKELINHFNTRDKLDKQLKERFHRTRNGWWIYNIEENGKTVFILKKWKHANESMRILDVSTNAHDAIGKEAKVWLEEYLKG